MASYDLNRLAPIVHSINVDSSGKIQKYSGRACQLQRPCLLFICSAMYLFEDVGYNLFMFHAGLYVDLLFLKSAISVFSVSCSACMGVCVCTCVLTG